MDLSTRNTIMLDDSSSRINDDSPQAYESEQVRNLKLSQLEKWGFKTSENMFSRNKRSVQEEMVKSAKQIFDEWGVIKVPFNVENSMM